MQFSGWITSHTNDDAETPLRVEYDYDEGRVKITAVRLIDPPMGWVAVTYSRAWEHWDYADRIDADAVLMRCAEHAAETQHARDDRIAAEREDADDARRELAREART